MIIGLLLGLIIGNMFLKNVVGRLRPFEVEEGIKLLIDAPKDPSFPSGHTLASVTSATILFLNYRKRAAIFIVLAILIALSRLYLYVHFPSDVIAGAILGVIIGNLSVLIYKKFQKMNWIFNINLQIIFTVKKLIKVRKILCEVLQRVYLREQF